MKNKFIYLAILSAGLFACEPEFENEISNGSYSAGEADFTSYVAIGNSLTSGVMDGTVSRGSQMYSFPNILSQQFAIVGGGAFTQPSYTDDVNNLGGLLLMGNTVAATRMIINAGSGGPENIAGTPTIEVSSLQATAYHNMGIPQAKTFHLLLPGYGNIAGLAATPPTANPYFVRHATSPMATVMDDAMSKNPTFFTNWIGNNDVLGYATGGGTGNTAGLGGGDITPAPVFESSYLEIIDKLTSNGAKGVVATIPQVTSIPFFTTVPYNPLTAAAIGQGDEAAGIVAIQQLNAQLYGPVKQILTLFGQGDRINLLSETNGNPLLIKDETLQDLGPQITAAASASGNPVMMQLAPFLGQTYGQVRHATASDLVLLPVSRLIGASPSSSIPEPFNKFGITYPLQDEHILIPSEITEINAATLNFNNIIKSAAASKNLAVADMTQILEQLVSGLRTEDGQIYTADYFSTANIGTVLFSLDGIHPNARGYAVISNEIIKVINRHYGAKLPLVSAGNYPGATVLPSN